MAMVTPGFWNTVVRAVLLLYCSGITDATSTMQDIADTLGKPESFNEFLKRTLGMLCPYTKFCTHGPALQLGYTDRYPCCSECSCEEDCELYGTCCPDYQRKPFSKLPPASLKYECLSSLVWPAESVYHDGVYEQSYFSVASCPASYDKAEIIDRCMKYYDDDPLANVRVSDKDYLIYKNKHCALCNGVTDVIPWLAIIHCTDPYLENVLSLKWDELKQYRCSVTAVPPVNQMHFRKSICINYVGVCDSPMQWGEHHKNIAKACSEYRLHYTEEHMQPEVSVIHYKNPYCYICNKRSDVEMQTLCVTDTNSTGFKQPPKRVKEESFLAVLDAETLSRKQSPEQVTSDDSCAIHEVSDPHFSVCRNLTCPVSMVPTFGTCRSLFKYVKNMDISIVLKLVEIGVKQGYELVRHSYDLVRSQLNKQIMAELGITASRCVRCPWMASRDDEAILYITATITTIDDCHLEQVLANLKHLQDTQRRYKVRVRDKYVYFTRQLVFEFKSLLDFSEQYHQLEVVRIQNDLRQTCQMSYFLRKSFHCASIDIPAEEYTMLINQTDSNFAPSNFDLILDEDGIVETYRICHDVYLHKLCNGSYSHRTVYMLNLLLVLAFLWNI